MLVMFVCSKPPCLVEFLQALGRTRETADEEQDLRQLLGKLRELPVTEQTTEWHNGTEDLDITNLAADMSKDDRYFAILHLNGLDQDRFEEVMKPLWEIALPMGGVGSERCTKRPISIRHKIERITALQGMSNTVDWGATISIWIKIGLYLARNVDEPIPSCMT
jgi:hypothetical protein